MKNDDNLHEKQIMERQSKIEANKALAKKWILEGWNQNRNREVIADVFAQNWKDGSPISK